MIFACALLCSNTGIRWDVHASGLHAHALPEQDAWTHARCLHARDVASRQKSRMHSCLTLPAAARVWPPAPLHLISRQSIPMPFVAEKSCSNPRAYKPEVHRQRGTLVESRPCWQVVPLPSQAFSYTIPHESESESESESLCQLFLSRPSLLLRRSHSSRMSAFFPDYLRQTMP